MNQAPAKVLKAVLPAGGRGMRLRPLSLFVPKEMLKLGGRPVLDQVVEEALAAGVREVFLVVSPRKLPFVSGLGEAYPGAIRLLIQEEPLGVGHAVLLAREAVGREPFLVALPDEIYTGTPSPSESLATRFASEGKPLVLTMTLRRGNISDWGVIDGTPLGGGALRVGRLVEKPAPEEAPSRDVLLGRYVLTPDVFEVLSSMPPGRGGELHLTDAISILAGRREVLACPTQATRRSVGNLATYVGSRLAVRPEPRRRLG